MLPLLPLLLLICAYRCRRAQDAKTTYVELMKTEAGVDKVPVITVEEVPARCLPSSW